MTSLVNTNLHVTREQARGLLRCVHRAQEEGGGDNMHDLPSMDALFGLERMLMSALERIADLETRNRVALERRVLVARERAAKPSRHLHEAS